MHGEILLNNLGFNWHAMYVDQMSICICVCVCIYIYIVLYTRNVWQPIFHCSCLQYPTGMQGPEFSTSTQLDDSPHECIHRDIHTECTGKSCSIIRDSTGMLWDVDQMSMLHTHIYLNILYKHTRRVWHTRSLFHAF
jgi:hypothetical protein